jgi:hypothetical protein
MFLVSNDVRNAILAGAKEVLGTDFRVRLVDSDPLSPAYQETALIAIVKYEGFSKATEISRDLLEFGDMGGPHEIGRYIGQRTRDELVACHRFSRPFADRLVKLEAIAEAAVEICDGQYDDFEGQFKLPHRGAEIDEDKLRKLARCLSRAGYEWMELT